MADISRDDSDELYRVMVCYGRPSIAFAMLQLWERPWSPTALRYAYRRLHVALAIGCDVLEATPEATVRNHVTHNAIRYDE